MKEIEAGYFFNPIKRDIAIVQGDTCSFGFQLQGLQGQRPTSIILSCKETVEDEDPLFMVSDSDTIDERSYDETNDILTYSVRIPPYLTQEVPLGRYFYDLQIAINNDVITLMIGRLSLEYQVTKTTVAPPQVDDGDEILYPRDDIEIGAKKAYTESKVNNIANGINLLLNQASESNISGFTDDLARAQGYVEAISNILNLYLVNDTTYHLPDVYNGIGELWNNRESIIDNSISDIYTEARSIAAYKFYNNANLHYIVARECTELGDYAFNYCENLYEVDLPNVETLGAYSLAHCPSLTDTINLPKVKEIKEYAFYEHTYNSGTGLSTLKLSNSAVSGNEVFSFGEMCFANNWGAISTADSLFRWIDVDDYHFLGSVSTRPTAIEGEDIYVTDTVLYSTNPQTFEVFNGAIVFVEDENLPYVYKNSWIPYVPEKRVNFYKGQQFHSTRVRDIGFTVGRIENNQNILIGSQLLFIILDYNIAALPNLLDSNPNIKAILATDENGDLTDELPYTTLYYNFKYDTSLVKINLPYVSEIRENAFEGTNIKRHYFPSIERLGVGGGWKSTFRSSTTEEIILGDGSNSISMEGFGHFRDCPYLYSLTLNSANIIDITSNEQTMQSIFDNSPIYNYLGTTTTVITEGASAGSVEIDGATVSTVNNNIVSYGGEDWKRVNNIWTKWGNGQDKTPRIYVPSNQIDLYKAHAKWSALSPEIWRAIS